MSGAATVTITNLDAFFEGVRFAREAHPHVDPINAGLWALAGYDTALVHCAEMRERLRGHNEDYPLWISLNRFISMYLEAQCKELVQASGLSLEEAHKLVDEKLVNDLVTTTFFAVGTTSDPMMLEVLTYAMYLGTLTAHGQAPWNKYAAVMAECFYTKHPAAKKFG